MMIFFKICKKQDQQKNVIKTDHIEQKHHIQQSKTQEIVEFVIIVFQVLQNTTAIWTLTNLKGYIYPD